MKIVIGADVVPTETNVELFIQGEIEGVLDDNILNILQKADYRIYNLEVPLTDKISPIKKNGPAFAAPVKTVNGLKKMGADLLVLANNHIKDQGNQGVLSTINVLKQNEIGCVGAGENLSEAIKPFVLEKDGIKLGIYACVEHEFSIADEEKPGANPFEPLEILDHIAGLKQSCDYVVVLYHGGKEQYRYPTPNLQKVCRRLCDKGADLVVCQHSHCIGCRELYKESEIIYGQGNFIFDRCSNEFWDSGMLLEIDFSDKMAVHYVPFAKTNGMISSAESKTILSEFMKRSEKIKEPGFVKTNYKKYVKQYSEAYINAVRGNNFLFRALNKLSGHRLKRRISEKDVLKMCNYIECESNRELIIEGLKEAMNR